MKQLGTVIAVSLLVALALASDARADQASAIGAAKAWWKEAREWGTPPASKKAPVAYAIRSKVKPCKKLKVGKATTARQAAAISACVASAYNQLIPAESDFVPTEQGWNATSEPIGPEFDRSQRKAIAAVTRDGWIVTNTFYGEDDDGSVQVFFAVSNDDVVRGMWMLTSFE